MSGALAEATGILLARERLERFGGTLVLLGTAAVVLAVATGYLAANTAPGLAESGPSAVLGAHERLALLGASALLLLVVWKGIGGGRVRSTPRVYALALILAAAFLLWAALLGGRLVYEHGVGITGVGPGPG